MGSTWRAVAAGLSLAAAAVALSACSASPPETSATTTTTTLPLTSTTSSSTTSTTTSTATTTTTATAACQVSGLRLTVTGQGGAAGTQEITFSLTNTSTSPCGVYGYPGMLLVSTSGAALPTTVERGGALTFEDIAPTQVTLAAGQSAYFNLGFDDVQTATTSCSSTHTVEVTPPTTATHATVAVHLGVYACDNGTLHVSPVFAPTNAAATQTTAPS